MFLKETLDFDAQIKVSLKEFGNKYPESIRKLRQGVI